MFDVTYPTYDASSQFHFFFLATKLPIQLLETRRPQSPTMLSYVALAAAAFAPGLSPMSMAPAMRAVAPVMQTGTLDAELVKTYPRDFKNIPTGTAYGEGADEVADVKEPFAATDAAALDRQSE